MIYAMSDIHGCLDAFEYALSLVDFSGNNKLILLGDYVHGPDGYGVIKKIMQLQNKYGSDKVTALLGNHEEMACDGRWPIGGNGNENACSHAEDDDKYLTWMQNLPRYYSEGNTIFVHAGIDEEAEDLWEWGTDDYTFTEKYPAQTGRFYNDMKIVAGHIGTAEISGNPSFHDIYFDGESHYYIDGTVLESGIIPVMKIDTENNKYYRVTDIGTRLILPYDEEKRRILMNLSKIKAVIADDDVFKGNDIRKALEFNGVRNIMTVRDQEKLWEQIYRGKEKIDLIVTDMEYPLEAGEAVDEDAGFKLIERMQKEKINIPVIVCSSLNYSIPDILGNVWYNELNDLNFNFKEVLDKLEKNN